MRRRDKGQDERNTEQETRRNTRCLKVVSKLSLVRVVGFLLLCVVRHTLSVVSTIPMVPWRPFHFGDSSELCFLVGAFRVVPQFQSFSVTEVLRGVGMTNGWYGRSSSKECTIEHPPSSGRSQQNEVFGLIDNAGTARSSCSEGVQKSFGGQWNPQAKRDPRRGSTKGSFCPSRGPTNPSEVQGVFPHN